MSIIKKENVTEDGSAQKTSIWLRIFAWLGVFQLSVVVLMGAVTFYVGEQLLYQNPGFFRLGLATAKKSLNELAGYRIEPLRILGYNPDYPVLNIDIKQKNYRKLEFVSYVDQEISSTSRSETEVKASIRIDDRAYPIKIRLKGDRRLHWTDPKNWSFRIKVRDNKTIMGMRVFSLQRPVARNFLSEWVFHKLLKK